MEILSYLLCLARESCVQVWLLGECRRGSPLWKWAYLKFSVTIREVVSSRLRTRDEQQKLRQRSGQLWHLPKNPSILERRVSGQRGQSSVFWLRVATLPCIAQDANPPHLQAWLDTSIAWGPERKVSCPEGVCSPEPPNRQLRKAPPQHRGMQVLLAFSLEVKAAKVAEDKRAGFGT